LDEVHLRVYAGEDYLARWNEFFGWGGADQKEEATASDKKEPLLGLAAFLGSGKVTLRKAADAIGADPSFLSKVLKGKNPPAGLLDRIRVYLARQGESTPEPVSPAGA